MEASHTFLQSKESLPAGPVSQGQPRFALEPCCAPSLAGSSPGEAYSNILMDFSMHSWDPYESIMLPEVEVYKAHAHNYCSMFQTRTL